MTTVLGDFPDLGGAPDVDPADCIPSLARKPHGHDVLCVPWKRGDFASVPETRRLVRDEMERLYPGQRRAF